MFIANNFPRILLLLPLVLAVFEKLSADIPAQVASNGFGLITLTKPLARYELDALKQSAVDPAAVLWIQLPDGKWAGLDWDVTKLLPENLVKVYTMSSLSPQLLPGTIQGAVMFSARSKPAVADGDWKLQPNEVSEKRDLVKAFQLRYGNTSSSDLAASSKYYSAP